MAEQRTDIRFQTSGADKVIRELQGVGATSKTSFDTVEKSSQRATRGLGAVDRSISGLGASATRLTSRLGPLGGILQAFGPIGLAVGAGLGAVAIGMSRTVSAGIELERTQARINQLLETTGGVSGQTAESIEALAQTIGRETLASTRNVREAAAQLLTFRNVAGDAFGRTLALAQDLASLGFGSLSTAAVQLAKALEDPQIGLSNLRRVGVSFSKDQIDVIKRMAETGRQAEAMRAILDQVEAQVGGAGRAEAGGLAGAFDSLTEEVNLFFEAIASNTGILTVFTRGLAAAAEDINAVREFLFPSQPSSVFQQMQQELEDARAELQAFDSLQQKVLDAAKFFVLGQGVDEQERERQKQAIRDRITLLERSIAQRKEIEQEVANIADQEVELTVQTQRQREEVKRLRDIYAELAMTDLGELGDAMANLESDIAAANKEAAQFIRLTKELEDAGIVWDVPDPDEIDESTEAAERQADAITDIASRTQTVLADIFRDSLNGQLDLLETLKQAFFATIAEMVAKAAATKIEIGLGVATGTGTGTEGDESQGAPTPLLIGGGALSALLVALQIQQQAQSGQQQQAIGTGVGAVLGGSVGFLVGGPGGAIIGGLLGSQVGGLVGAQFGGGDKDPKFAIERIDLAINEHLELVVNEIEREAKHLRGQQVGIEEQIELAIETLFADIQAGVDELSPDTQENFTEPIRAALKQLRTSIQGVQFDGDHFAEELGQFLEQGLPKAFKEAFAQVAAGIEATKLRETLEDEILGIQNPLALTLTHLQRSFEQTLERARELEQTSGQTGLVALAQQSHDVQLNAIRDNFLAGLEDRLLGLQDPTEQARRRLVDWTNAMFAQAHVLGINTDIIYEIRDAELALIAERERAIAQAEADAVNQAAAQFNTLFSAIRAFARGPESDNILAALAAITTESRALIDQARAIGRTDLFGDILGAAERRRTQLGTEFLDDLRDRLLQLQDPIAFEIQQLDDWRQATLAQARALGISTNLIDAIAQAERALIDERNQTDTAGFLKDLQDRLLELQDPIAFEIQQINEWRNATLEQARALGLNTQIIYDIVEAERALIDEREQAARAAEAAALSELRESIQAFANPENNQFLQALDALNVEAGNLIDQANELGQLDLIPSIRSGLTERIDRLTEDFAASISDRILQDENPLAFAILELDREVAAMREAAIELMRESGTTGLLDLVDRFAEQQLAILRESVTGPADDLRNFLQGLISSPSSPLAPTTVLDNARSAFDLALQGTDTSAVIAAAQDLLSAGSTVFASGPEFFAIFSRVQTSIQSFADALESGQANQFEPITTEIGRQTRDLLELSQRQHDETLDLAEEQRRLLERVERVLDQGYKATLRQNTLLELATTNSRR